MSFGNFQSNTGTGMFGAAKPNTTGFTGFGTPATTAAGFSFGTTPTATPASTGFGAATTGFGTGLTFGSPQTVPGLQFGAPQTTQPTLQFGATQPAASGFSLGNTSFGAPATSTVGGVSFGATTTSAPSLFGSTVPTLGAPAGGQFNFNLGTAATPSTGLSLGAAAVTTASTGFSFGLAKPTTTSSAFSTPNLGLNFNIGGGLPGTMTTAALSTVTTTTTVGLGGVDSSQTKTGLSGVGITEPKQVKDHQLPDPILQSFNDFQAFVKQQKSISVDVAHSNSKPVKKVQEDIDQIESLLADITHGLTRNTVVTEKLKTETAQGLFNADMAQRLREAPNTLNVDNGTQRYFTELQSRFEKDMFRYRYLVESAERYFRSITDNPAISPQEFAVAMRRIHETLIVLAAHVQSLHLAVNDSVEKYRQIRQKYLKEDVPVTAKPAARRSQMNSLAGPIAFSETAGTSNLSVDALSMLTGGVMPLAPATTSSGLLPGQSAATGFMSSPSTSFLTSTQPVENSAFQLSKPPVGNKRNKRND